MSGALPLASFATQRFAAPRDFRLATRGGWIGVNDTEYLLTAHHLPLVVRLEQGEPVLCALVAASDLPKPTMDAEGRWLLGYLPIALRTYPFVLSGRETTRPIDELDILPHPGVIGAQGAVICADLGTGQLGPELTAIRNTLHMTRTGKARLTRALDLLRIAGILVPLAGESGEPREEWTVDPAAFMALGHAATASLAHQSFLPLDLASAILFSRRHLWPERLPKPEPRAELAAKAPAAIVSDPTDFMLASLEAMDFALDASDLFDLGDAVLGPEFAPPPPDDDDDDEEMAA